MLGVGFGLCAIGLVASFAAVIQNNPSARGSLAPSGRLRVGINFGNTLLTKRDPSGGDPGGVAPDLARELGRQLDVPVDWVVYESAGKMAEGAIRGAWDVAFLATDPGRVDGILFTPPYLEIDATYLVPDGSPLRTAEDVDHEGIRIAVTDKSAYDLFLTRSIKRAQLVRASSVDASIALFLAEKLEVLAGLRPVLLSTAEKLPGSRVLGGRFTAVQQALGTPKGREAGAQFLHRFIEEAKASGLVANAIERHGVRGVSVAPMTPAR